MNDNTTTATTPKERVDALLQAIAALKDDDLNEVLKFDGIVEERGRRYLDALAYRIAARVAGKISAGRAIDQILADDPRRHLRKRKARERRGSGGQVMSGKRFQIRKLYEGPPVTTPWGIAKWLWQTVERYDDELTARVRVAVLNEGLAKKKYFLDECVDPEGEEWVEVDDDEGALFYVDVVTPNNGEISVFENEVASITKADLKTLGMSRAEFERVFVEGKALMTENALEPDDGIRPVVYRPGVGVSGLFYFETETDGALRVVLVPEAPVVPRQFQTLSRHRR